MIKPKPETKTPRARRPASAAGDKKRAKMPKWERSPDDLVALFNATMASFPEAALRKMFGYPCAFINGNMATGLFGRSWFVRLSAEDQAELLKTKGAAAFEPVPGRAMRGYFVVPGDFVRPVGPIRRWVDKALRFTSTLPPKAKVK